MLQWGRGLGTAESIDFVCKVRPLWMLQWGRGLGTAERCRPSRQRGLLAQRFNGAAVLGPRRAPPGDFDRIENYPASMGPRSWDRGELAELRAPVPRRSASMGPRSWDRGEFSRRLPARGIRPGFNGAAVLGPRRACSETEEAQQTLEASMGPRSWDRGETTERGEVGERQSASMGPRSWDRGETGQ